MQQLHAERTDEGVKVVFADDPEVGDRLLEITVTGEGVVIDAYADHGDTLSATTAMTADEWFEQLTPPASVVRYEGDPDRGEVMRWRRLVALGRIHELMDGVEWSPDTLDAIAQTLERVGFEISPPEGE